MYSSDKKNPSKRFLDPHAMYSISFIKGYITVVCFTIKDSLEV